MDPFTKSHFARVPEGIEKHADAKQCQDRRVAKEVLLAHAQQPSAGELRDPRAQ